MIFSLGRGETIEDTGKVLSRYVEVIAARVFSHDDVLRLSEAATVPVINSSLRSLSSMSDFADSADNKRKEEQLQGLKLSYVGDGNNVCNTLTIGGALVRDECFVACPANYHAFRIQLSSPKVAEKSKNKIAMFI